MSFQIHKLFFKQLKACTGLKNWGGNKILMWKGSFMYVNAATDTLFNLLSSYILIQQPYIHITPVLQKAEQQHKHHLPIGNLKFKFGILN